MKLRLGTRKSALAMWQANHLKKSLESMNSGLEVELVKITTTGDRFLSRPLDDAAAKETGVEKGFFTKELEEKLISKEILNNQSFDELESNVRKALEIIQSLKNKSS